MANKSTDKTTINNLMSWTTPSLEEECTKTCRTIKNNISTNIMKSSWYKRLRQS